MIWLAYPNVIPKGSPRSVIRFVITAGGKGEIAEVDRENT